MSHLRVQLLALLLAGTCAIGAPGVRTTVRPADTGEILQNPGMGWVFHHYDNSVVGYGPPLGPSYAGEGWPGLSVAYLRLAWSYLEPEDGVFDWSWVDTVAQRYIDAGRQVAFRFSCFESSIPYATPEWLKEKGVGGRWFRYGVGIVDDGNQPGATWEPDYDDPVFLAHLDRFLAAAAARYDGNPNVAFVDIGTIGIWGEGNPCTRGYPLAMYKTHIDLHAKHFKKTLLVGMDDWRPRPEFQRPGTYTSDFAIRPTADLLGRALHVKAGIWLPGDEGKHMPQNRFLPAFAAEDRRVNLGTIDIAVGGSMSFTANSLPETVPGNVDYVLRPSEFTVRPHAGLLRVTWTIKRQLPKGAVAFCHVGDADKDIRQSCGFGNGRNEALDYARSLGATMRDDSIIYREGFTFTSEWMAEDFWRRLPVVLESGHYRDNDYWERGAVDDYLAAVEAYHGSYISIHGPPHLMWRKHEDVFRRMSLRMGYRLQLVEASWPEEATAGHPILIRSSWRNAGVAPCYPDGNPCFTLKDADGAIRAVWSQEGTSMRALAVGQPGKAPVTSTEGQFRVPNRLTTGDYGLFVSVGERDGSPRLALPLGNDDGKHRYRLGSIHIRVDAQYRFTWQPPRKADNEWQLPVVFETLKPLPPNTQPFAHLDLDSRIAHGIGCALVEGNEALRQPGKHVGYLRLNAPDDAQGKTFDLHVGLWILRGQRLLAETGAIDRRIHLGTVSYAEDGTPVVTPR